VCLVVKCYMFIYLQKHRESKKEKKKTLDIREIGQHLSHLSAVSAKKACKNKLKAKNEWRFSLD
jgi:hypothetical protein